MHELPGSEINPHVYPVGTMVIVQYRGVAHRTHIVQGSRTTLKRFSVDCTKAALGSGYLGDTITRMRCLTKGKR